MKRLATTIALLTICGTAAARPGVFDGLLVGMEASLAHSSLEVTGLGKESANSFVPTLNVSVRTPAQNGFSVAFGATFDPHKVRYIKDGGFEIGGKHDYSFYLAPGYQFNRSLMAYAKVGYHHTNTYASESGFGTEKGPSFGGVGYGGGLSLKLSDALVANLEFQQIRYNKKEEEGVAIRPTSNRFTLGLAYRFDVY